MLHPLKIIRRRRFQKMLNQSAPALGHIGMGAAVGAAAMYFLDPNRGGRRRALVRDRMNHASRVVEEGARVTARDMNNRAYGWWATVRRWFRRGAINDEALITRVRAKLGRVVSHPHAIEVAVHDGTVTLSGPILAREVDPLLTIVRKVRGVREIDNRHTVYQEPGNVSALQGGRPRVGHFELMQANWSPTTRLLTGLAGGALVFAGLRQRTPLSIALAAAGAALLARSATNRELKSLVGVGKHCRGMDVYKTVNIGAPREQVFGFWSNFENFPHYMSNVRQVRKLDDKRSQWTVAGPAGAAIVWTSELTAEVPNELIAWRSVDDAPVQHSGSVRFDTNEDGSTRVSVWLCYCPPAGALGHAVAKIFGSDPKSEMDEDFARIKTAIESGKLPHDAAARKQAQVPYLTSTPAPERSPAMH